MALPDINVIAMVMAIIGVLFLMIGAAYLRSAAEKTKIVGTVIHGVVAMVFLILGVYILSIYGLAAIG